MGRKPIYGAAAPTTTDHADKVSPARLRLVANQLIECAEYLERAEQTQTVPTTQHELLNLSEAARELRVSERTVHRLIVSGKLYGVRAGRRQLVSRQAIHDLVAGERR